MVVSAHCTSLARRRLYSTLRDAADELRIVGLTDARCSANVGGEIAGLGKIPDVADGGQECGRREHSDTLDGYQVFIARKCFGKSGNF